MKLTKYRDLNKMFDLGNFFRGFMDEDLFPEISGKEFSRMKVDVYEKDGKVNLEAELPGASKDDIDITLNNGILTISSETKSKNEVKEKDYYFSERSTGSFSRSFSVGEEIDENDIKADFKDGILHVEFKKLEEKKESETKKIKIN